MTEYWPCDAGQRLFAQLDRKFGRRDHTTDGWIGDASHQASQTSDHNPCWTCPGDRRGVVRAIDIDADFSKGDPDATQRFANQLIALARDGKDGGRLKYVIFNGKIASGTYPGKFWEWRDYSGADPHTGHIHVSFTAAGDFDGSKWDLPMFTDRRLLQLRDALQSIRRRLENRLVPRRRRIVREIRRARADAKKVRHNIAEHLEAAA